MFIAAKTSELRTLKTTMETELTISSESLPCPGGEVKARDTLVNLQQEGNIAMNIQLTQNLQQGAGHR